MRLIDADELIEHVWRDRLHTRELIAQMIENAPTVKTEKTPKEIKQQIHEFAEKMYQAGYDEGSINPSSIGFDHGYERGLYDAWECARKIAHPTSGEGLTIDDLCAIFGMFTPCRIFGKYKPSEAIQKIKDYEEQQKQADAEIRVGDEVCGIKKESRGVVTDICHNGCGYFTANVMMMSGKCASVDLSILYKTGKHYSQIAEVLKELKGDENNADSN